MLDLRENVFNSKRVQVREQIAHFLVGKRRSAGSHRFSAFGDNRSEHFVGVLFVLCSVRQLMRWPIVDAHERGRRCRARPQNSRFRLVGVVASPAAADLKDRLAPCRVPFPLLRGSRACLHQSDEVHSQKNAAALQ